MATDQIHRSRDVKELPADAVVTEVRATLNSYISRPFERPQSGRISVKVINHLGDGVMKVFKA